MSQLIRGCLFETERLRVTIWHDASVKRWPSPELIDSVISVMTTAVTRSLPAGWQGEYTLDRAKRWIEARDAESTVLQVTERSNRQVVGLLLLAEEILEDGSTEIRPGYLLAESAWGRGLATELIAGFVEWCRQLPVRPVITAGVGVDNPASSRVLEKCGFTRLVPDEAEIGGEEHQYQLDLR